MRATLERGFTLLELLVVIGIIAVLAVALLPNVFGAGTEGERVETQARIQFLVQAAEAYERKLGHYPADDFVDVDGKPIGKDNGINTGIESLVLFLCQQRLGSDSVADHEDWLGNTDEDDNTTVNPQLERRALVEVLDAWGMPLFYACGQKGGYARPQRVLSPEGATLRVSAFVNPETGRPAGKGKFQLISAGPDGEFGTGDDIVHPPMGR